MLQTAVLGFTEFYWVLLGFTGFYWVLLGFTGFFRFLLHFGLVLDPGFPRFSLVSIWFCGFSLDALCFSSPLGGFTGFHLTWVCILPSFSVFTGFYRVLPGFYLIFFGFDQVFTGLYWVLPGFTGL